MRRVTREAPRGSFPAILAALFLGSALVFAIAAFRNFPVITVVATVLLISALPFGMVWWASESRPVRPISRRELLFMLPTAMVLAAVHVLSLTVWRNYVSNLPNLRLESGNGYHEDTAFHVSIIQGILHHGYPTTGQHFEPFARYHTLSHFADAGVLAIVNVDPWESYALLFFAKGVAILLGAIYFSFEATRNRPLLVSLLTLLMTAGVIGSSWISIGSHGLWLPTVILLLSAPAVYRLLKNPNTSWPALAGLTALVVALTLGKVSLGFSFALFVGLWLFANNPRNLRVLATGVLWVLFLGFYFLVTFSSRMSSEQSAPGFLERFSQHGPELLGLIALAAVVVGFTRFVSRRRGMPPALALLSSFLVITLVALFVVSSSNDAGYFVQGLFFVVFLLVTCLLLDLDAQIPTSQTISSKSERVGGSERLVAFGAVFGLLVSVSPVITHPLVSPSLSLREIVDALVDTNTVTYRSLNSSVGPGDSMSVARVVFQPAQRVKMPENPPYFERFRERIGIAEALAEVNKSETLLFLSAEDFEFLSTQFDLNDPWAAGLLVTAVTGNSLLYGVVDPKVNAYGFPDYPPHSAVKRSGEVRAEELCRFSRPVVIVADIVEPQFEVICSE